MPFASLYGVGSPDNYFVLHLGQLSLIYLYIRC